MTFIRQEAVHRRTLSENTLLSPVHFFSPNRWMVTFCAVRHKFELIFNVVLSVPQATKNKTTGRALSILPDHTCVNINQNSHGETSAPYLDVLRHILCVGYLFYVSVLDSFDTDSCQVDLAV